MKTDYSKQDNPDGTVTIFKKGRPVTTLVPHDPGYRLYRHHADGRRADDFLTTVGDAQDGIDVTMGIFR